MTHVAVDLLGGDGAPDAVVNGIDSALGTDESLEVSLVGPSGVAERLLAERRLAVGGRLRLVEAPHLIGPGQDAAREVRSRRDATVRVATRLIRDGVVDAVVSAGPFEALVAAASFTLGPAPGATRPALAVLLGSPSRPTILLDAGAATGASADQLVQYAVVGSAYATVCLDVARPRIGLLVAGPVHRGGPRLDAGRPGVGGPAAGGSGAGGLGAGELLAGLGLDFVGAVDAAGVVAGGQADVVVCDGSIGAVVVSWLQAVAESGDQPPQVQPGWYPQEGAFVVGVDGIVVVAGGRSGSTGSGIARAIAQASVADRSGWVPRQRAALADLVARRRTRAGLSA
ncbi:phosphate starvation-inducible protein PhoH [Protofrankia symbiont of Coriaria ruscifolia]|uniref:phosphate acyltransferase n=1 Tax=Candidatus Protofrankia californiensis TaxID=1839754 RepID=A0A1C3PD15_9ACTN|nr:phosphate starvation-inducible protein PhoH [Protofrankia symbiont of Coriaria ruscifolia]SBW27701.1 fatty acid synthesis plsX protein [Candidatus Protofrankia californiensis]